MEAAARRLSAISLRRGSRTPSIPTGDGCHLHNTHLRRSSRSPSVKPPDGVSLASRTVSAKGSCGFLSSESLSGIKYAVVWTVYVLIGSWLFLVFERTVKTQTVDSDHWIRYKELVRGIDASVTDELYILKQLLYGLCPHPALEPAGSHGNHTTHLGDIPVSELTPVEVAELELQCAEALKVVQTVTVEAELSFVDSIYYTMTLVTTIGYGHIYPKTRIGRLFAVLFAMVGVPLTCILMAKNSNILSMKMLQVYKNLKRRYGRGSSRGKILLYLVTWVYLSIGFIVFMFIPSVGFVYMESWTYDESLYYTFITLSTIGFGEMVGAYGSEGPYSDFYKIAIVVWIMIALGYWVMLLNFLQKALKTKLVPKRIRVQFKAKQLAKQAEFLRQLMTKVREQWSDEPEDDGDLVAHIVNDPRSEISLMAEAINCDGATKGTRRLSLLPQRSRRPSLMSRPSITVNDPTSPTSPSSPTCSVSSSSSERHLIYVPDDTTERSFLNSVHESTEEAADDVIHSTRVRMSNAGIMSLADLLEADVVVRTPKVPLIRSLMEESTPKVPTLLTVPGEPPIGGLAVPGADAPKPAMDDKQQAKFSKEVTLPLKDVLGLVTLVANLEGQMDGDPMNADTSIYSTIHSMVSMDAKLPLLREAYLNHNDRRPSYSDGGPTHSTKYKAVNTDDQRKHSIHTNGGITSRLYQRRGSCLDAFLDDQTKREYIEVGKESDDKTDTMSDEMETEEVDVDALDYDDDDTFNAPDIIVSLDDDDDDEDDDDEAEEIEDFLEADDGSRQSNDHYKLSRKSSGANAV